MKIKSFFTKSEYGLMLLTAVFLLAMVGVLYAALPAGDTADYVITTQQPGSAVVPEEAQLININTATAEELDELPGIGPVLAGRIVDYRTEHGPFESEEDLMEVSGIGQATLEELRGEITLE